MREILTNIKSEMKMNEIKNEPKGIPLWLSISLTIGLILFGRALLADLGMWLIIIGGSIWMWVDSKKRDLSMLTGFAAIKKPFVWFVCGVGLFIVAFPVYLSKVYEVKQPVNGKIKSIILGFLFVSFLLLLYSVGSKKTNSFAGLKTGMTYSQLERAMFCERMILSEDAQRAPCSVDWLKSEHSIIFNFESGKVKNMIFVFEEEGVEVVLTKIINDIGNPDNFTKADIQSLILALKNDKTIKWSKNDLISLSYLGKTGPKSTAYSLWLSKNE